MGRGLWWRGKETSGMTVGGLREDRERAVVDWRGCMWDGNEEIREDGRRPWWRGEQAGGMAVGR